MYKKSVIITYEEKQHEIQYPTVGQQLEIENLRNLLSNGTYRELARVGSKTANELLNIIDGYSVLCVMLPVLNLKPEEFGNLDVLQSAQISRAWLQFFNFQNEVGIEINKLLNPEKENGKK